MSKKKFDDFDEGDEWLERLLDEYIHNRLPEAPIKEEEEIPSAEFCRKMEKLIDNPRKWKKYIYTERRRIQRLKAIRTTAFATIAIAFLTLVVRQFEPIRTSAFIPIFALKQVDLISDSAVLKPSSDADSLNLPSERGEIKLPEFVVDYVPSDFVHDRTSDGVESHRESYISRSGEATFYIAIRMFNDEHTVYFDEKNIVEQIVVGDKDVTKLIDHEVCIYLWKEGEYLFRLHSYQADEKEMKQVIEGVSLIEAK